MSGLGCRVSDGVVYCRALDAVLVDGYLRP